MIPCDCGRTMEPYEVRLIPEMHIIVELYDDWVRISLDDFKLILKELRKEKDAPVKRD